MRFKLACLTCVFFEIMRALHHLKILSEAFCVDLKCFVESYWHAYTLELPHLASHGTIFANQCVLCQEIVCWRHWEYLSHSNGRAFIWTLGNVRCLLVHLSYDGIYKLSIWSIITFFYLLETEDEWFTFCFDLREHVWQGGLFLVAISNNWKSFKNANIFTWIDLGKLKYCLRSS